MWNVRYVDLGQLVMPWRSTHDWLVTARRPMSTCKASCSHLAAVVAQVRRSRRPCSNVAGLRGTTHVHRDVLHKPPSQTFLRIARPQNPICAARARVVSTVQKAECAANAWVRGSSRHASAMVEHLDRTPFRRLRCGLSLAVEFSNACRVGRCTHVDRHPYVVKNTVSESLTAQQRTTQHTHHLDSRSQRGM